MASKLDIIQAAKTAVDEMLAGMRAANECKMLRPHVGAPDAETAAYNDMVREHNAPLAAEWRTRFAQSVTKADEAIALYKQYKQLLGLKVYADNRETWDALSDMHAAIVQINRLPDWQQIRQHRYVAERALGLFVHRFNQWAI